MNPLLILLLIPGVTLLTLLLSRKHFARIAITGSVMQFLYTLFLGYSYYALPLTGEGTMAYEGSQLWFKPLGIYFSYGLDGIAMVMILLTSMVVLGGALVSASIDKHSKEFFILLVLLGLGAYGYFISTDVFTLFFFLELAVVPKYLLIVMFGSGNKDKNAMKLALMLMTGSVLVFIGLLSLFYFAGEQTGHYSWNLQKLAQIQLPFYQQVVLYHLIFCGFGIFTAMFPFHSWAPDGHSSAPTAASMFLAGVSMKLGGYGCLHVATYLFPEAAASYSWIYVILGSAGILYGAFVTLVQKDLKYMNAFSSVSHCGFVILGIAMLTPTAIKGAVIQMVSHGIMTALFFAVIGMIYQRTHTRQMSEMGGILEQSPFIGSLMLIVGLCSLGLPGMSGFVGEMTIFVGSWERMEWGFRVATIAATCSIVVTAVYILRSIGWVIWGNIKTKAVAHMSDATPAEKAAGILLVTGIFAIGLFPFWMTHLIDNECSDIANRIFHLLN